VLVIPREIILPEANFSGVRSSTQERSSHPLLANSAPWHQLALFLAANEIPTTVAKQLGLCLSYTTRISGVGSPGPHVTHCCPEIRDPFIFFSATMVLILKAIRLILIVY